MRDEILELDFRDPSQPLSADRREFLKIVGGGIFILVALGDAELLAQQRGRRGGGPGMPSDPNAFPQDRRGRARRLLHGKDRDGARNHHLLGPNAGRRVTRAAGPRGRGDGRYRPLPLRHGDFRIHDHAILRAGVEGGGRDRQRRADRDGRGASGCAAGPTRCARRHGLYQGTKGKAAFLRRTDQGKEDRSAG